MSEVPKLYKGAAALVLGFTVLGGVVVYSYRSSGGSNGFLSSDPFIQGPIELYDKNNPDNKIHVAGRGIQIDTSSLSPQGDKLAYSVDGVPVLLHIVNINGQKDWVVPNINANDPSWSPTGDKIAFTSWGQTNPGIWVADVNSENPNPHRITTPQVNSSEFNPLWSPTGDKIAYIKTFFLQNQFNYDEIWTVNKDGSKEQMIVTSGTGSILNPNWSPDGENLIFQYTSPSQGSSSNNLSDIYTVNIVSGNMNKLTVEPSIDFIFDDVVPKWSPDRKKILYQEYIFDKKISQNITTIYTMNPDGSNKTLILDDVFASDAGWTPDGKGITFSTLKNNRRGLYLKNLESGEVKLLKDGENNLNDPSWWPSQK